MINIKSTLYSIGHGNKSIEEFIEELKSFNIKYLLDIRSKPYSKWNPHFNQTNLKFALERNQIKYVFLGNVLGGLPDDRSCYNHEGKVLYDVIKDKEFFKVGLERLILANQKHLELAIMCSESNPVECHRTKLIGQELLKSEITLKHIISNKVVKSQQTVMNELTRGFNTIDLFGNTIDFKSRKAH